MRYTNWPPVLKGWEGDTHRFVRNFRTGLAGLAFLIVVPMWVYFGRGHYQEVKKNLVRYGGLLFVLFYTSLSQFLILGIASDGFKISPAASPERMEVFNGLSDIQFYVFVIIAIIFIFYMVRRKNRGSEATANPDLHPNQS